MPTDKHYLDVAARLAYRGFGAVEPNPMVGAVIVRNGRIVGLGHHRRFGGLHAEAEAVDDCRRRGESAQGATAYVTLEPCNHTGKNPPCSRALINAGVSRVVIARADPNPVSAGGADTLRAAGIAVEFTAVSPFASSLADAFITRITERRPWVIVKWAQTIDGRIATRTGASQWISSPVARRRVHRLRARVDAVLTAMGTVRADNPRLTTRDVSHARRTARRILIDPRAELSPESALVATLEDAPLTVIFDTAAAVTRAQELATLAARGVELFPAPAVNGRHTLRPLLQLLAERYSLSTVLVEAGPTLIGSLIAEDLIDEAHVYVAPMLLGDEHAVPAARGLDRPSLADANRLRLHANRRVGPDSLLVFRRLTSGLPPY